MRPVEFTPEEIIKAGQELQAVGRNITGFALRQKVGGGSPARLKQVWDEHLQSQVETKAEPVAELPLEVAEAMASVNKALAERLTALAVEVNDKAVKAAERRVADVLRSASEHREGLESRLAEIQTDHQTQAVKLAQVSERLALIEEERARYEQQTEQMRNERDTSREDAAKLRGTVEALQAQVKELMQALGAR